MTSTAIIGAGISGLACARRLSAEGHEVTLFDKGRGPGGRMSTRRVSSDIGELSFDHGAQFFTSRDPAFNAVTSELAQKGLLQPWENVVRLAPDGTATPLSSDQLWVGVPGMNALVRALAEPLDVRWGTRVTALQRASDSGWQLHAEAGALGVFDQIVVAVPAEQVFDLLSNVQADFSAQAEAVHSDPCWTAMLAFDRDLAMPYSGFEPSGHDVLGFVSCNNSKPGRRSSRASVSTIVVQATPAWSIEHLEDNADQVAQVLHAAFADFLGNDAQPVFAAAHRWRYARVGKADGAGALWDEALGVGVCGDWLLGPRVECGFLSGDRLAQLIGVTDTVPQLA